MGIGSHIVEALLKNHAKVVIADMADCDAYDDNENVMYVKCNVTKKEEVEEMVNKTVEKLGKLDCLVNNAGVNRQSSQTTIIVIQTMKTVKMILIS